MLNLLKEWDARQLLESSNAINCPCVAHQLVGAKKMQQILSQGGALERFVKDKNSIKRIRDTFVGFEGLEMVGYYRYESFYFGMSNRNLPGFHVHDIATT